MKTIAFIPLRGGSKNIPLKNIKLLAGKPLCQWVIEAAAGCDEIEEVHVCTDDDRIAQVVTALANPKVFVSGRSVESASDTASTEFVMLEFAGKHEFGKMVLIQATSPLLTSQDLASGLAELNRAGADSLLSVVPQKRFIWSRDSDGVASSGNYDPRSRPRRQEMKPYYVENGAFYICEREALLRTGSRLPGKVSLYEMREESYFELDEPSDWDVVEAILAKSKAGSLLGGSALLGKLRISADDFRARVGKIKLFLTDVDGVLTDAGMYYSECGDEIKKFNTRDGKGIELLRLAGILTGIITVEDTKIVERRAAKLKVNYLAQGAVDKMLELGRISAEANVTLDEVAYIGDDLADIPVLEAVGLACCPSDAVADVAARAHYICSKGGGNGAVREFAEQILRDRGLDFFIPGGS